MISRFGLLRRLVRAGRFVLPPICPFCATSLRPGEPGLCRPCRLDLPWNTNACPLCAAPCPGSVGTAPCARCLLRPPPFARVLAPLRFEFPVDAAVRALKYRRRLGFLPVLAGAMHAALFSARVDCDVVVPVPLHFLRHARRGFNQAERLAARVAGRRRLPLYNAVERVRATSPQTGLTASERRHNLKSAFRVSGALDGARVLIIDDVYTTGSTVRELARALGSAGAAEVSVLVAARGGGQAAGAKV